MKMKQLSHQKQDFSNVWSGFFFPQNKWQSSESTTVRLPGSQ